MAQRQQVRRPTPIPEANAPTPPEAARSSPWLIGALVGLTLAFAALLGWTVYERLSRDDAAGLARAAAAAWDSARPSAFASVYDPAAVVVDARGHTLSGIDAIAAAARSRGPDFTMTPFGPIAVTRDGSVATASYRYTGDGRGVGIVVIQVANGKIVREWHFEPSSVVPIASAT